MSTPFAKNTGRLRQSTSSMIGRIARPANESTVPCSSSGAAAGHWNIGTRRSAGRSGYGGAGRIMWMERRWMAGTSFPRNCPGGRPDGCANSALPVFRIFLPELGELRQIIGDDVARLRFFAHEILMFRFRDIE